MSLLNVSVEKKIGGITIKEQFSLGGEIMVLSGPSGAGKTTLLDCIAGTKEPDRGQIFLNGRCLYSSPRGINLPANSRNLGYVLQNSALFPHLTVSENVFYGYSEDSGLPLEAEYIFRECRLEHLADSYPRELSGGEKQRVALARTLLAGGELLLFDEPLASLDEISSHRLQQLICSYQRKLKVPVIYVTHNAEEASYIGDRIYTLGETEPLQGEVEKDERCKNSGYYSQGR